MVVILAGLIVIVALIGIAAMIATTTRAQSAALARYQTVCAVGTITANNYVAIYALYGTPTSTLTHTPLANALTMQALTPTATSTPINIRAEDSPATVPANGAENRLSNVSVSKTPTPTPTYTEASAGIVALPPKAYLGDAASGKTIFNGVGGCSACHEVNTGQSEVGPSLQHIASIASGRIPGASAPAYLRESIVAPDAYLVAGYPGTVMPQNYERILNEGQIIDLIAYLMSLQ